jgi:hypothetical protein
MNDVEVVDDWKDEKGIRPFCKVASNMMPTRTAGEVLRVLRNALAHGNIVYLDKDGLETRGSRMVYMAFLSRYEETPEQRQNSETYRLVATEEESFLSLVKCWAEWISSFGLNSEISDAA